MASTDGWEPRYFEEPRDWHESGYRQGPAAWSPGPPNPPRRRRPAIGPVLALFGLAFALGVVVTIQLIHYEHRHHVVSRTAAITGAYVSTTEPGVAVTNMPKGSCVLWSNHGNSVEAPRMVDCSEPHFVELIGNAIVKADNYPGGTARLDAVKAHCGPLARSYLGYDLLGDGRFQVGAFVPTQRDWLAGDHTLSCDLQYQQVTLDEYRQGTFHPFEGRVRGQTQWAVNPPGICWVFVHSISDNMVTPCTAVHDGGTTGSVDVSKLANPPVDREQADVRLETSCELVGEAYATHHRLPGGVVYSYTGMFQADWDAGDRLYQCTWEYPAGDPSTSVPASSTTTR